MAAARRVVDDRIARTVARPLCARRELAAFEIVRSKERCRRGRGHDDDRRGGRVHRRGLHHDRRAAMHERCDDALGGGVLRGGPRLEPTRERPARVADRRQPDAATDRPGIYRVKQIDLNQAPHETWIAYNVPPSEGNLALATSTQIRQQLGADADVDLQEPGEFSWIEGKDDGQDVRNVLLWALVLLLIAEQALAYKMSYHPKPVGAAA